MIGVKDSENNHFTFKHLCGLMRITLGTMPPADADRFVITAKGENTPALSGTATVADITEKDAKLEITKPSGNSITYYLDNIEINDSPKSFFIPLPVGYYEEIEVSFYGKGKSEPYFKHSFTAIQVRRAVMISLPVLDWSTGAQYVLSDNTKEITTDIKNKVSQLKDDPASLIYMADLQKDQIPAVGNIVWSKVTDAFPYGFLGKVSNVTENGNGSYLVTTETATLNDAFEKLYIDEEVLLAPSPDTKALLVIPEYFPFDANIRLRVERSNPIPGLKVGIALGLGIKLVVQKRLDKKNNKDESIIRLDGVVSFSTDCEFKSKDDLEKQLPVFGKEIKLPPLYLAGGLIYIRPTLNPCLMVKASGEFDISAGLQFNTNFGACAKCVNGNWESIKEEDQVQKTDNKSPWNFSGGIKFNGELFMGFGAEFDLKLYNLDDLKVGLSIGVGPKASGEIELNVESLKQVAADAVLSTSVLLNADFEAKLGPWKPEAELLSLELWKHQVSLIPHFNDLSVDLRKENLTTSETNYSAKINTEASGDVLTDNIVRFALKNEDTGEVEQLSDPVEYVGNKGGLLLDNDIPPIPKSPQEVVFENLEENATYRVYPIIKSSVIKEYTNAEGLDLQDKNVEFSTGKSEKEKLIDLYKATGGRSWKHSDNWCSDKPLSEWYGISVNEKGKVERIDLSDNNMCVH